MGKFTSRVESKCRYHEVDKNGNCITCREHKKISCSKCGYRPQELWYPVLAGDHSQYDQLCAGCCLSVRGKGWKMNFERGKHD